MLRKNALTPVLAAALLLSALAQRAAAQDYQTLEVDLTLRSSQAAANQILGNVTPLSDSQRQLLTNVLTKYRIPLMTQTDPRSLGILDRDRVAFQSQFLWRSANGPGRQLVNQLTFSEMQKIVAGAFHPQVKYNAVLIIGAIDERGAPVGQRDATSTPYAPATQLLLRMVNEPTTDPMLQVAAWVGLIRHVQNGVTNPEIRTAALQLAAPQAEDDDSRLWLRLKALEVLTLLGPGEVENIQALARNTVDTEAPLWFRIQALGYLSSLPLPQQVLSALPKVAGDLGLLAYQAAAAKTPNDEVSVLIARKRLASDLGALGECLKAAKAGNTGAAGISLDAMRSHFADAAAKYLNELIPMSTLEWTTQLEADMAQLKRLTPAS